MRRQWLDILACPTCKAPLELTVEAENKDEIMTGSLRCARCGETYPIVEAIPNLLPKGLREKLQPSGS